MATIVNRSNYSYPVPEDGMLVYHSLHTSTNGVCLCVCVRVSLTVSGSESEKEVLLQRNGLINSGTEQPVRYSKWRVRLFLSLLAMFSATGQSVDPLLDLLNIKERE